MIDLTGQKFGRLIVIQKMESDQRRNIRWLCKCDCGQEKIVDGCDLKRGHTKSCGCFRKEKTRQRMIKHGHWNDKTYKSWYAMKQRCTNPNDKSYRHYGGRGITVCKRWINSFPNFLKDMGGCPDRYQIDRIDNDKGYYKENCRWVTPKQNSRNRRDNRYETYNGKRRLVIELAEEYNIPYNTLRARIYQLGWSIKKALNTPIRKIEKVKQKCSSDV